MSVQKGDRLKPYEVLITPELVAEYAELSGDRNRLHLDEEFARQTRFGTRIAHGMILVAASNEMLMGNFGIDWSQTGTLTTSFVAPTPVNATLVINGVVTNIIDTVEHQQIEFELYGIINGSQQVFKAIGSVRRVLASNQKVG
ncbi:MAG: MaoC family dehydratase [Syntrophomonadaceae bacterium]